MTAQQSGIVYYRDQYRYFQQWREARSFKGIERVAVIIQGKEVIMSKDKIKRFPKED